MLDYHLYNVWMRFWTLNWVWPIRRNRQIYRKSVHPFYLLHDSVAIMKSHYYFSRYLCQVNPLESLNIRVGSRVFIDFSNVVPESSGDSSRMPQRWLTEVK